MTREEAIKILKYIFVWMKGDERWTDAEFIAIEMAIKALEKAQLSEQDATKDATSDCISRQAAIDAIKEIQFPIMRSEYAYEQFVFKGMSEALKAIKALPSSQPKLTQNSPILSNDFGELTCSQAPKVKLPVESFRTQLSPKGFAKTVRLHSYVAMLTRKDSHEVLAVRYDGFETKEQVHTVAAEEYEDWNIKGVWRLYDEDF